MIGTAIQLLATSSIIRSVAAARLASSLSATTASYALSPSWQRGGQFWGSPKMCWTPFDTKAVAYRGIGSGRPAVRYIEAVPTRPFCSPRPMGSNAPHSTVFISALTPIFSQKPATASPIWTMKGVPGSAVFQNVNRSPPACPASARSCLARAGS